MHCRSLYRARGDLASLLPVPHSVRGFNAGWRVAVCGQENARAGRSCAAGVLAPVCTRLGLLRARRASSASLAIRARVASLRSPILGSRSQPGATATACQLGYEHALSLSHGRDADVGIEAADEHGDLQADGRRPEQSDEGAALIIDDDWEAGGLLRRGA